MHWRKDLLPAKVHQQLSGMWHYIKKRNDYEWKLIVNGHTVDGPVIADIPEILNQGNILVLNNFLTKIAVCKSNTDYPDILERCIEIKEPFPGLSKERLALLVQSSLGYY